jgi:AcrR family transcriptional regulator
MQALCDRVRFLADHTTGTHRDFATAVRMDPTQLSKSLAGTRRFRADELATIAAWSAVSLEWLLHGTGPTPTLDLPTDHGGPEVVSIREVRRREEILQITWRLIARRGYYRVRLIDVATACGTSAAALHHYFPSKRGLLQSALLHCAERAFSRQSQELDEISDARDALGRLTEQLLPVPGQGRDEWLIWLQVSNESALHPDLRGVHNDFHRRWLDLVAGVVRRGREQRVFRDVDALRFALGFMSLADGLAIQLLTATPGNTDQTMRDFLREYAAREVLMPSEAIAH